METNNKSRTVLPSSIRTDETEGSNLNQVYEFVLRELHAHRYAIPAESEQDARSILLRRYAKNQLPFYRKGNLIALSLEKRDAPPSQPRSVRGLFVEPGRAPWPRTVSLEELLTLLPESAGCLCPFADPITLICRDPRLRPTDGPNRLLRDPDGTLLGIVSGAFFLCGLSPDGTLLSLSDELMEKYALLFQFPDEFLPCGSGMIAVPRRSVGEDFPGRQKPEASPCS